MDVRSLRALHDLAGAPPDKVQAAAPELFAAVEAARSETFRNG
jgi:hypothetical protein